MRDRQCSTATVEWDRTTHVSCVALHSPLSGATSPTPRPSRRRRAFPCLVSSARSGQESLLCWRAPEGAEPVSVRARGLEWRHIGLKDILANFEGGLQLLSRLLILPRVCLSS